MHENVYANFVVCYSLQSCNMTRNQRNTRRVNVQLTTRCLVKSKTSYKNMHKEVLYSLERILKRKKITIISKIW